MLRRDGLTYTVRPEKIRLLADGEQLPDDSPGALEGTVREVSYLGSVTRYEVELSDGTSLVALQQNLETTAARAQAMRGRRVRLAYRAQDASPLQTTKQEETSR